MSSNSSRSAGSRRLRVNCGSAQHVLVLGQERGTHEWDHLGAQAHSHDPDGRSGTEASAQEDVGVDHNVLYVTHATEDITPAARPPLGSPGPCTAVAGSDAEPSWSLILATWTRQRRIAAGSTMRQPATTGDRRRGAPPVLTILDTLNLGRLHVARCRAIWSHRLHAGGHGQDQCGEEFLAPEAPEAPEAHEQPGTGVLS